MFSVADHAHMARALQLARLGRYTTDPNPRVGCVLVRDGSVVGEGFHRRAGEPHAERMAIADAGGSARGATAYVTLEPCCHHGRTPPCTEGLLQAGVVRVVAAMIDPNPLVGGKGLAQLREAGVEVASGLLEDQARALNPGFVKRMAEGVPYVRLKLAMSLDGRTAMASGESQWITGEAARRDVQRLRAGSSAIVTGIGTVLADDPSMNVRLVADDLPGVQSDEFVLQPLRVVLDTRARMPADARMLSLPGITLVCVGESADEPALQALRSAGAEVLRLPQDGRGLQWPPLLQALAQRGVNEVLLECGATLAGSGLQAGVVDELIVYQAPHLMGDAARGLVKLPGIERMAERIQLRLLQVRQIGDDLRLTYRPGVS
jgi:diaminohydroxyphosphoribosylaminopyrimidine deaminase / 5-amino-6-(5-phosphoribosylamino)uracil reductase